MRNRGGMDLGAGGRLLAGFVSNLWSLFVSFMPAPFGKVPSTVDAPSRLRVLSGIAPSPDSNVMICEVSARKLEIKGVVLPPRVLPVGDALG